jgi:pyruvate formate lyase activating enzyme
MIFDIQHYAVHDGPGIRTLVFFKGCPLACAWCANPESRRRDREVRQILARCRSCLRCARACPSGAIAETDGRPRLDRRRCAMCGGFDCVAACRRHALIIAGEEWSLDDLIARVAKDIDFYRNSGGGVTFSGGEPFAQAEFLLAALAGCKRLGIPTAVETCGQAARADILAAEPLVDLFLFDFKVVDSARHRKLTGVDNGVILDNLRFLADRAPGKIVLRLPVVPGLTDDEDNIEVIAAIAAELHVARVELCPYHPLGRPKYAEIGLPEPPDPPQPLPAELLRIAGVFEARGIRCGLA